MVSNTSKVRTIHSRRIAKLKIKDFLQRFLIPLVIIIVVTIWVSPPAVKLFKERSKNYTLKRQLKSQINKNKVVRNEINKLKTPAYVEKIARKDLGLAKAGEIQYYVLTKKIKGLRKRKEKPKGWWQPALDFIEKTFTR